MAKVLNLTPLQDEMITLVKGERQISFPDRLPAPLVPHIMRMVDAETGQIDLTPENLERLFQIVARLIVRANPHMTEEEAIDFLDVQDLLPIITALLNPPTPPSSTAPTGTEATPSPPATRTRRG
jgi:hypothetical protein